MALRRRAYKFWPSSSSQTWSGQPPAIAVVDSGVDTTLPDLSPARVTQFNLSSDDPSSGDAYGHGTFVAGIAAGAADAHAGAAPTARIISLKVLGADGSARTSDVINAADWIYANAKTYGIRVANFSLHAGSPASVMYDPLDRAVEKLWLSGVVVVAAAGNYATSGQQSGVPFGPGNDPFVITVGADDINGSLPTTDDFAAPWSAWGYTLDGFAKAELSAPGRYMIGPAPMTSTLAQQRPASIVAPGYMELSGTSFAAPVVAGAAADLLAAHPNWTPDQVKGALMLTAQPAGRATSFSDGVGVVNAAKAVQVTAPPNPNLALDQFVGVDSSGGLSFNAASCSASWADNADDSDTPAAYQLSADDLAALGLTP